MLEHILGTYIFDLYIERSIKKQMLVHSYFAIDYSKKMMAYGLNTLTTLLQSSSLRVEEQLPFLYGFHV